MFKWVLCKKKNLINKDKKSIESILAENINTKSKLEKILMNMDSDAIKKILKNLTISEVIRVLKVFSNEVKNLILNNIEGEAVKLLIIDKFEHDETDEREISEAQQEFVNVVLRLKECGEIK